MAKKSDSITISRKEVEKKGGVVILDLKEYQKLLVQAVPTYQLYGKEAAKLDELVREGMREAVTYGTSVGLNVSYVEVAAKTGTAEIGSTKRYVNSWSIGFFPFDHPKLAWAVVMEKGPSSNTFGATSVVRILLDWITINAPQYFE